MNNPWNKVIYRLWAPFYDYVFNSGPFLKARKKIFENLDIKPKSKVLFVGVGTGADLQFIKDKDVSVTAIDLSSEMLDRAKNKYDSPDYKFIENRNGCARIDLFTGIVRYGNCESDLIRCPRSESMFSRNDSGYANWGTYTHFR